VRLEQLRELLVPEDAFATDMEPAANTVD
jgi:hypothetical protein